MNYPIQPKRIGATQDSSRFYRFNDFAHRNCLIDLGYQKSHVHMV